MPNELKTKESSEVALSQEEQAKILLDEASSGTPLLKFNAQNAQYHLRKEEVSLGTRYFAYPGEWYREWVHFEDGKLVKEDRIRIRATARKPLPARSSLSHPELTGEKDDPWTTQNGLPLENVETGAIVVFVTSTAGGRMAIEEMVRKYGKAVLADRTLGLPIIELQVDSFLSAYGSEVNKPFFKIVAWESDKETVLPPDKVITGTIANNTDPDETVETDDDDDEIPF
jgi:hypothetical protein